jgi:hypothetical protein
MFRIYGNTSNFMKIMAECETYGGETIEIDLVTLIFRPM